MNLIVNHEKQAIPTRPKPEIKAEFFDPQNGKLVSRFVDLSVKTDLHHLNRLMIWAANNQVELRIRPVH